MTFFEKGFVYGEHVYVQCMGGQKQFTRALTHMQTYNNFRYTSTRLERTNKYYRDVWKHFIRAL